LKTLTIFGALHSLLILSFMACIGSVWLRIQSSSGLLSTRHKLQVSCKWRHFIDHMINHMKKNSTSNPEQLSVLTEIPWFRIKQFENLKKQPFDSV